MTYITKYSDKKGTAQALTEEKINACLVSLENNIASFTPTETVQDYAVFEFNGDYYKGITVALDDMPAKMYNIWTDVNGLHLRIGYFTTINGKPFAVFDMDRDRTDHITETSLTQTESGTYETEWLDNEPTQPSDESTETTESFTRTAENWSESGTITNRVTKKYENWNVETRRKRNTLSERYYTQYKGTATWTKQWTTIRDYDRTVHLTNISVYMEYPKERVI